MKRKSYLYECNDITRSGFCKNKHEQNMNSLSDSRISHETVINVLSFRFQRHPTFHLPHTLRTYLANNTDKYGRIYI